MSTPDRQELIRNAVAFLADPKSQASPVTQRISFLEAKGLSPAEIDIALKQASFAGANSVVQVPYSNNYGPNPYALAPPPGQHRWDWRDYFITAVVSGAVTYGAVSLFKKYLFPHLQPPTSTAYEEDRDALEAQFDAAEALLKEIQTETAAVRAAVEEQKERIDKTTEDVKSVVVELRDGETKTRDEMREIREEVTNIREMLPKMIEKNKDSQNQSLNELQQELKSLKALLLSRGPSVSSMPSTPIPLLGRPSIPAWQLASPPQNNNVESPSMSSAASTVLPSALVVNGKVYLYTIKFTLQFVALSSVRRGQYRRSARVEPRLNSITRRLRLVDNQSVDAMFSQFRNAVEHLAQETSRALEVTLPESQSEPTRSQSLDNQAQRSASPPTSSQLAESAISNLRKSFASQRNGTPAQPPRRTGSPAPAENRVPKSNLEERLRRATFAIGEASGSTTPNRSTRASPSPMARTPVKQHPMSPSSTPLPGSPLVTPAIVEQVQPTDLSLQSVEEHIIEKDKPSKATPNDVSTTIEQPKVEAPESESPATQDSVDSAPHEPPQSENTTSATLDSKAKETDDNTIPEAPPIENAVPSEVEPVEPPIQEPHIPESVTQSDSVQSSPILPIIQQAAELGDSSEIAAAQPQNPGEQPSFTSDDVHPVIESNSDSQQSDITPNIAEPLSKEMGIPIPPPQKEANADHVAEVEALQDRLRQVEQRFSDVSTSFKRLQAEKQAADAILRENSPLESIKDATALTEFFSNLRAKDQVFQDEIKRLNQKLETQEDRLDELRDTHRLESHSQSDEVQKLRTQLEETEALFQAAQRATTQAEETGDKHREEIARLHKEIESSRNTAKEEEEKRVKAISLLKTVRQKLVKAEKEKEDALKEIAAVKDRERGDKNKEQAERQNFQHELESVHATHEKAIASLRAQYDKDFSGVRERYDQEISAVRGQLELDLASTKSAYTKEISTKSLQIAALENSLNKVTRDKNAFFDSLQQRQAELESAQAHLESLEHQNTELQFQLRESNDRLALLREETNELVREQENRSRDPVTSADEVARMVSATEAKYEARLAEMKRNLAVLEKERYESEADWSRKLKEKVKDLEDLKRVLGSASKSRETDENMVADLKSELARARESVQALKQQASEIPRLQDQLDELEKSLKEQEAETKVKVLILEKQIEETKTRESQTRQANKTLREELRKVQSSAALLERQRNPGVGYWTTRVSESTGPAESRMSISSPVAESPARVSSPTPSTATSNQNEEEVNLEYLRNVILQFLEHKEMRPNLVKVLSIILHFTPQETRRLIAKV
ncbi:hypothetical protein B0H34DRAFT_804053 [Crassisporium funariophilum]|nr:hypothetical protein B0H34DRAFT_804053 [Crassisporium funariophilum]